jgi:glycosyltransferase involved in cell wall biosynthesis
VLTVWNIADCLITHVTDGHQFWEPRLLSEELRRRGKTVRLLGHHSIEPRNFPAAECVPLFPLNFTEPMPEELPWGRLTASWQAAGQNSGGYHPYLGFFRAQNRSLEEAMTGFSPRLSRDSLVLFPNVTERQLFGICRWAERLNDEDRPSIAIVLAAANKWPTAVVALYREVVGKWPEGIKRDLRLCARSEMSARRYEEILGFVPHVLPSALTPSAGEIAAAADRIHEHLEPMTVAYVGGARLERGALLVPEIVRQCRPLGVRFSIQVTDASTIAFGVDSLKALSHLAEVEFHLGPLPRETYNDWVARSVLLLPYDRDSYRWRSSGVYFEAKCFGSPVIVPAGTWMAEDVSACGNGLIFDELSPAAISRCIAAAQRDLPNLRARAAAAAAAFRAQHGADRFVDAVEKLFSS